MDAQEPADSLMNLARAKWLTEYLHEQHINGTAEAISFALFGKRSQ